MVLQHFSWHQLLCFWHIMRYMKRGSVPNCVTPIRDPLYYYFLKVARFDLKSQQKNKVIKHWLGSAYFFYVCTKSKNFLGGNKKVQLFHHSSYIVAAGQLFSSPILLESESLLLQWCAWKVTPLIRMVKRKNLVMIKLPKSSKSQL